MALLTTHSIVNDSIDNYRVYNSVKSSTVDVKSMLKNTYGIFGLPYQFLKTCDPRISDDVDIGGKYAEKIVARMPLLFMTPCKQKFMSEFNSQEKSTVLEQLITGSEDNVIQNILKGSGKYYTTEFKWDEYYRYVHMLCTQTASFMGIQNVSIPTPNGGKKPIRAINWQKDFTNNAFNAYFNASRAVVFYLDGQSVSSMSESFSNNTTESSLASTINGYSETTNEVRFLLGENSGIKALMDEAAESISNGITSNLSQSLSGITGDMLSKLGETGISTVLSGGKLVFPKLWQDSSFSRSYSFDIKLRSPDHDNLSIFLNIMVPYLHLLALVLPVAHEDYANSYNAPFLVKAYCKGLFSIDMGMITDMSVSRGAECQWNDNGLPTQMDISISIEDLYSSLYMSSLNEIKPPLLIHQIKDNISVATNTYMMDYLANLAGLNIAEEEFFRAPAMILKLTTSAFRDIGSNLYNRFDNEVAKFVANAFLTRR